MMVHKYQTILRAGASNMGHRGIFLVVSIVAGGAALLWAQISRTPRASDPAMLWRRYRTDIAAARRSLDARDMATARRLLLAAPVEYRNWEWLYLRRRLEDRRARFHFLAGEKAIQDVAFSPDGGVLASAGADGTARTWDTRTGRPLRALRHGAGVVAVAFDPVGHALLSAACDNQIRRWDLRTGQVSARLWTPVCGVKPRSEASSADGKVLAACAGRTVRLWDSVTQRPIATLVQSSPVSSLSFTPEGSRLAVGCAGGFVNLWDLERREAILCLRAGGPVQAVAFSPDGTRLAAASADGSITLWDSVPARVRSRPEDAYRPPRGYVAYRATGPIKIDGRLDEPSWQAASWTEDFVDIEDGLRVRPRFRTRAKILWDDTCLYIGAQLQEPHVWATLTQHDSVIFRDPDFEVFIDPDGDSHNYAELEMNALNTTWDLRLPKPYKDGGTADDAWELTGLKTAVHVDGTLNNPHDTDRGWTVEMAIPWAAFRSLSTQPMPPHDGDQWRLDFSRVEWRIAIVDGKYQKIPYRREDNWVWSPQAVVDMHRPETWGYVQFSTARPGTVSFRPDSAGPAKHLLHRVYYAEADYFKAHGRYARTLAELGLTHLQNETLARPITLQASDDHFHATAEIRGRRRWHIRQDARTWSD